MNDKIHHDGKGGFETESFRVKSSRVCDCVIPEPRMKCSENGTGSYCSKCSRSFVQKHFLDTPAGRYWDNIVSWRNGHRKGKNK